MTGPTTEPDSLAEFASLSDFKASLEGSLFRSLAKGVTAIRAEFGPAYLADFDSHLRLLRRAHPERPWPAWAVNGYVSFNRMVLREELAFRERGAYSAGAEDMGRITADIYDSGAVMDGYYLVGLYATYFVWPHHYRMLDYYRRGFLGADAGEASSFAEWGVGHGLLSAAALSRWPAARGWMFDLSAHSLGFARRLLDAAGHAGRCAFVQGDVAADPDLPVVDRLVCSEVLEHVPRPDIVMERVRDSLAPGGRAFLTAAVSAPQADHVYLFRGPEDVFAMADAAGLTVRSHLCVVHPNRADDPSPPRVVGMVVSA